MLRTKITITIAALVLAGCAKPVIWDKYGATQAGFNRDQAQCDYETSAATQNVDYGYRTVFGQALDQAMRQNDLMAKCLIAKGYTARHETVVVE